MEGAAVEALEAPTETDLTHQGKSKFHMNVVKYCFNHVFSSYLFKFVSSL
jgi:hypothetical protein